VTSNSRLERKIVCAQTKSMRLVKIIMSIHCIAFSMPALAEPRAHCEEEERQAAAWIQWASERRASCLLSAGNNENRTSCLQDARQDLAALEQEHSLVYKSQIRTLPPEHPIVKTLLAKLKDNVRAAETAISTDAELRQISAQRKQTCLNRR
jgi:hypothetical protein